MEINIGTFIEKDAAKYNLYHIRLFSQRIMCVWWGGGEGQNFKKVLTVCNVQPGVKYICPRLYFNYLHLQTSQCAFIKGMEQVHHWIDFLKTYEENKFNFYNSKYNFCNFLLPRWMDITGQFNLTWSKMFWMFRNVSLKKTPHTRIFGLIQSTLSTVTSK